MFEMEWMWEYVSKGECELLRFISNPCKSTFAFYRSIYLCKIAVIPEIIFLKLLSFSDGNVVNDQEFLFIM